VKVTLDIIIVNWNGGKQIYSCLKSIAATNSHSYDLQNVVVVDNDSTDRSLDYLEDTGLPLIIIRNGTNRGFAAACNQGTRGSSADCILFLNPDTILSQDSLIKSLKFLTQPNNARVGIVGIQLLDDSGNVGRTCARFPTPARFFVKMLALDRLFPKLFSSHFMKEWDHNENREVDQVMGAFFLVRRSLFEELRGFDERFFVYFEEVDFALRAHKAGWRTHYLAEAQAYHKGGGTSEQAKAARLFYSLRSRILYGFKHFGRIPAISLMLATLFIEPLSRTVYALTKRSAKEVIETIRGYLMLWRDSPNWFRRVITKA
jgi:N-acetylglucosaminyl-diphospho-decaprenol L-rhamnosyltransferase